MSKIRKLRQKIDKLDKEVIEKIGRRRALVKEIFSHKDRDKLALRDLERERKVLEKTEKIARQLGIEPHFVTKIFKEIINYSVDKQVEFLVKKRRKKDKAGPIVVAYQGTDFSNSHLAGQHYFASDLDQVILVGCKTFREAVESVEENEARYAILPAENTTAGSINETYDLLNTAKVFIVGEEVLYVDHCLIGIERIPLARIRRIYSHPQALQQCSNFLAMLPSCTAEYFVDTAEAVKKIKEERDISQAAIANEVAAKEYDLIVLKKSIANQRENFTRFVVIAKEPLKYDLRISCKTSIIMSTAHQKGALARSINILAKYGLNMTKLESRPKLNIPWEYLFYIDFEGNTEQTNVKKALNELRSETTYLKILGSYPIKTAKEEIELKGKKRIAFKKSRPPAEPKPKKMEGLPSELAIQSKYYHLVSRLTKPKDTQVKVGEVIVGGKEFVVIAGPCAVESEEQIMQTARWIKEQGGHILRGGVFKPRTSPYSFQGLGLGGLEYLARAGAEYNLPIVAEVLHPEQVAQLFPKVDMFQIGARNMQNFALLNEVGMVNKPVLLKRGMMASIDELLAAAEYILSKGNQQVILCERGIRTFETITRNTLDISAVPVLKERTHLPIIVDPSHATGCRRWIIPLAKAALVCGAHGIMVEVHPQPEQALSDGEQSLFLKDFSRLMDEIMKLSQRLA